MVEIIVNMINANGKVIQLKAKEDQNAFTKQSYAGCKTLLNNY